MNFFALVFVRIDVDRRPRFLWCVLPWVLPDSDLVNCHRYSSHFLPFVGEIVGSWKTRLRQPVFRFVPLRSQQCNLFLFASSTELTAGIYANYPARIDIALTLISCRKPRISWDKIHIPVLRPTLASTHSGTLRPYLTRFIF